MSADAVGDTVRLGIVGYGAQGSTYARLVRDGHTTGLTLAAICDDDPAKDARILAENPGVAAFTDYAALLASGQVDAVVTCVPHYLHPAMGIAALQAGVHALVEKPAGVYTRQVRELNEVAAAHPEVTFAIMFNQRTNPLYVAVKELVGSGAIGTLRHTSWLITTWWRPQGYYEQSAWRATWGGEGGGVLVNQAPHQLDLWQWICGMPRSVFARCGFGFRRDIAVEDEVHVLADFGNGASGVFVTTTHDLVGTDRFEILGDRGKIVVDGSATATITRLDADEQVISAGVTAEDARRLFSGELDVMSHVSTETLTFESAWGAQHSAVLSNFAAHILDGTPLVAPGADGIHGVRLANAIHLSAFTGVEVPLDFDEDVYLDALNARIAAEGLFPPRPRPTATPSAISLP